MRILWINTVGVLGGAERSLAELLPPLAALGHELAVACPRGPLAEAVAAAGARWLDLPAVRLRRPSLLHPGRLAGWMTLPAACHRLTRIIRATAPDVVHANCLAAMLALPPLHGRSALWHVRDLQLPRAAARLAARRAGAIVAISPAVEARLRELLPHGQHTKIVLIPNGISMPDPAALPDRAEARRHLGLPPTAPLVGMLAHFIPWKRHDRLIAAAAALAARNPGLRFAIAGNDLFGEHAAYVRRLRAQIAAANLEERVLLLGAVDQPVTFLRALDLLVHPADNEPFGRVVCEAMAAGTPVVAMNHGGPATILEHDVTGWLVDSGTPGALAEAVERLLNDDARRARLAVCAAARVREAYDIRATAARLSDCYAALAAPPRRP